MGDIDTGRFAFMDDVDDVLETMTIAEHAARSGDDKVLALGYRARELGATWREIADSVCITQQAATARWGTDKNQRGRAARQRRIERLADLILGRRARKSNFEHERRFLVTDPSVIEGRNSYQIVQAYVWSDPQGYTFRIRQTSSTRSDGSVLTPPGTIAFKGPRLPGGARIEIEQELPSKAETDAIIASATNLIVKDRFVVRLDGQPPVDVDVFRGRNEGLVIARRKASRGEVVTFVPPSWCGNEITNDTSYDNEQLAKKPWRTWESTLTELGAHSA